MFAFILFSVIILIFWIITKYLSNKKYGNVCTIFMSKEFSDMLKAYAIFAVLFGHVGNFSGIDGVELPSAIGVAIFLFCSGYGLESSYSSSGRGRLSENSNNLT